MKSPHAIRSVVLIALLIAAPAIVAQDATAEASREKTRVRLSALLQRVGPDIKVNFQPSTKSQ